MKPARGGDPCWRLGLGLYTALMTLAVAGFLWPGAVCLRRLGRLEAWVPRQRLGRDVPRVRGGLRPDLLIHAISAGEMTAAGVILRQLRDLRPGLRVVLSTGTRAGYRMADGLRAELSCIVALTWLPWDWTPGLRPWLRALAPRAVVVVETELWPALFAECARQGIALAVASGRLYPGDVWKYHLIRGFMSRVLACPRWIAVQDEVERERFLAIGARPERLRILGNAKHGREVRADGPARPGTGPGRLIVAGSTHAPEEVWLLEALADLRRQVPHARLILAPRHVERAAALRGLAGRHGWRSRRWSDGAWERAPWDVLILDRMGLLDAFYARADLVVMGGTLAAIGGHDFVAPARHARAILVGPHLCHVETVARRFLARGGLVQVRDPAELTERLRGLLADPGRARAIGRRAAACARMEGRRARGYGRALLALLDGTGV